jgi:micrococcal nuclease
MITEARQRYARLLLLVSTLVVLLVQSAGAQNPPPTALQGMVTRVASGDTIYVAIGKHIEKVRYIGINAAEIHHPTKGREPYGDAARDANARLVDRRMITLVLDVQQRDRFGRLLAYVYVDGRFVNAELVWRGYAEAATSPPNVQYADYFGDLQRQARERKHGLWGDPEAVAYYRPHPPEYAEPSQPAQSNAGTTGVGGSGGEVNVSGYTRSDGTHVAR